MDNASDDESAAEPEEVCPGIEAALFELVFEQADQAPDKHRWTRKGEHSLELPAGMLPNVVGVRAVKYGNRWQIWYPHAKLVMPTGWSCFCFCDC